MNIIWFLIWFGVTNASDFLIGVKKKIFVEHIRDDGLIYLVKVKSEIEKGRSLTTCSVSNLVNRDLFTSVARLHEVNFTKYEINSSIWKGDEETSYKRCISKYMAGPARLTALKEFVDSFKILNLTTTILGINDESWEPTNLSSETLQSRKYEFLFGGQKDLGMDFGEMTGLEGNLFKPQRNQSSSFFSWLFSFKNLGGDGEEEDKRKGDDFGFDFMGHMISTEGDYPYMDLKQFKKSKEYGDWRKKLSKNCITFESRFSRLEQNIGESLGNTLFDYFELIKKETEVLENLMEDHNIHDADINSSQNYSDLIRPRYVNLHLNQSEQTEAALDSQYTSNFTDWQNSTTRELGSWLTQNVKSSDMYRYHVKENMDALTKYLEKNHYFVPAINRFENEILPLGLMKRFLDTCSLLDKVFRAALGVYRDQLKLWQENLSEEYGLWEYSKTERFQPTSSFAPWKTYLSNQFKVSKRKIFTSFNTNQKNVNLKFNRALFELIKQFNDLLLNMVQ